MSKYGVFSDPYFPVFSPNAGKYGVEKTPYLDTFHAVCCACNASPLFFLHTRLVFHSKYFKQLLLKKESDFQKSWKFNTFLYERTYNHVHDILRFFDG